MSGHPDGTASRDRMGRRSGGANTASQRDVRRAWTVPLTSPRRSLRRRRVTVNGIATDSASPKHSEQQAVRDGLPTLADIGYIGAGGGIHVLFRKHPDLPGDIGISNQTYNKLLRGLRFTGERAMAVLTQRWRTLQHVTLSPSRTGAITQAALVLNNAWQ
ncbi:transposase family protein [Streptomyces sp. NPDC001667]